MSLNSIKLIERRREPSSLLQRTYIFCVFLWRDHELTSDIVRWVVVPVRDWSSSIVCNALSILHFKLNSTSFMFVHTAVSWVHSPETSLPHSSPFHMHMNAFGCCRNLFHHFFCGNFSCMYDHSTSHCSFREKTMRQLPSRDEAEREFAQFSSLLSLFLFVTATSTSLCPNFTLEFWQFQNSTHTAASRSLSLKI